MIVLWYAPLFLLLLLLWVLARTSAQKRFPWFFAYTIFAVVAGIARFVVRNHGHAYLATYWITEAGYDVLGILVMYEVFRSILGRLAEKWWGLPIFPCIVLVSIILSLFRGHAPAAQLGGQLMLYIVMGEIAVRFVQVLIFIGLAALVPLLGLRWRQYPSGIALGFGMYATVMLVITSKFSDSGTRYEFLWGLISVVAYSLAVLIWIWFFRVPQKAESPQPPLDLEAALEELKHYKQLLRRRPRS